MSLGPANQVKIQIVWLQIRGTVKPTLEQTTDRERSPSKSEKVRVVKMAAVVGTFVTAVATTLGTLKERAMDMEPHWEFILIAASATIVMVWGQGEQCQCQCKETKAGEK